MSYNLIFLGFVFLLTANGVFGLVIQSLLENGKEIKNVGQNLRANSELSEYFPHRFGRTQTESDEIGTSSVTANEPNSVEKIKQNESPRNELYYQRSDSKDVYNGSHDVLLKDPEERNRGAPEFWKGKDDGFGIVLWKNYLSRSQILNRNNAYATETSKYRSGTLRKNEIGRDRYAEDRTNSDNFLPLYDGRRKEEERVKIMQEQGAHNADISYKTDKSDDNTLHNSRRNDIKKEKIILLDKKYSESREPLVYHEKPLVPKSVKEVSFPENKIISEVYNMLESAENLRKMKELQYNVYSREEELPEAQRRFAEEEFSNDNGPYSRAWDGKWDLDKLHFTTITIGSLMLFLILVVMVLALRVHCRNREKPSQEWIRHPVVQPATAASDAIQPNFHNLLHTDHLQAEPIRIKAKGLLERRGSNTSLTIDLGPGTDGNDVVFSPTENTPENYLMTAGNRMGRRQLRLSLREPRNLHAEFWQIPTNHPDKCGVPGAAAKNRYRTVLPNEETRVILHRAPPDSPETPASQYINANYVRGYDGEEKSYIATQGPLAHTVEDLWLLVLQERSPAIVMITLTKENGRVKCETYIPSYCATYGSIQVTVKQVIQKNGYTIRQIYIKRGDEVHTMLHFWFTSWPDHKTPSSARHLLAMATEVEAARKENCGPVIVHCSAGIGRTGCFIAVSIGQKQLLEEDCVDILAIVCQMRLDRGGMVQTAEQYEFIHRALALSEASLPSSSAS